ncbi:MAG: response regulator transcription factor [Pseudomonadota bacterium]
MTKLNVLYVEDDHLAASALLALAAEDGDRVIWEDTGAAGLRRAAAEDFDLIILDRMLPDTDGVTVTRRLREAGIDVPILILSALGRAEHRVEGLEAGADDYLAKPYTPEELIARVRALHRRSARRVHNAVLIHGRFECHLKARTAFRDERHIALSPKEFELFRYFMENAGLVVTREMLLRDVWNMNFDPQTNVVDVNIGRLRRKLEEGFATPALETIWGSGYRLTEGQ